MKKFLTIIAVLGLATVLAGCGKKEETAGSKLDSLTNQATSTAEAAKKDAAKKLDEASTELKK